MKLISKLKLKKLKRKCQKSRLLLTWQVSLVLAAIILLIWSYTAVAQNATATPTNSQNLQETVDELQKTVNTMWVVFTGCVVFFMNAGFAMLETGLCRHKNAVNVLAQNFIVFALATVAFWGIGCALMFGDDTNLFFGTNGWFFNGTNPQMFKSLKSNVPQEALFFFQLVFADTAATIFTGAVAERIKFIAFFIFSFLLIGISYPITGHWIWGGGWLSDLGFYDFAGSTVVHSVGGWAGLVGALLLGPRLHKLASEGRLINRYQDNSGPIAMPGHNMSIATLGSLILWLGWFGFNAGSTLKADPNAISHILFTTNMAAAGGGIAATIISWWRFGKPELTMILNGVLAGLVSITASSAFVNFRSAFLIGIIAGILVFFSVLFIDKNLKIDDPVGAISVHLVNGIWGTLAVGLFSVGPGAYPWYGKELFLSTGLPPGPAKGLLVGGGLDSLNQLLIQLFGIFSVGLFTVVFSWLVWSAIKVTVGLRVSPEAEMNGLDFSEHDMDAYHGFDRKKV
ncbi:ammonium transporter [Scytonema sp. UIC 10036]|uniref:ammonium transporter n=1 Tax=Scytonema sp. UIC 10036 TaxID=2304196 RepID=UPI0012DACC29|nr:ammonium transporter [Scytonema sp. UIC 10036]MUG95706.1 ammonium transporter [Scytonema sp. UIC 10036]